MRKLLLPLLFSSLILSACADASRRDEITRRREALRQKEVATLDSLQQRLAIVDSLLEVAVAEYDNLYHEVMYSSTKYAADAPEVTRLAQLMAHRDSLRIEWQTLGRTIAYIKQQQAEKQN